MFSSMYDTASNDSSAAPGAGMGGAPAPGAASGGAPAPGAPIGGAPAAGGVAGAFGAITEVLSHGGDRPQTPLEKLIRDFLCNHNLWNFATVIGEMQYSCEILGFKNLKTRISRKQCFLVVTFKIAVDDGEQEVTVPVRKNLHGLNKIICKREEFIGRLALKVRPEGDKVTFNLRAVARNGETFAKMANRLKEERRKDPSSYPYVTAEQLLTYFLRCNPGTKCPRGIHTQLILGTDVPVTCPMKTCGMECLCTEPLPGT